jgi:hypothetical protein
MIRLDFSGASVAILSALFACSTAACAPSTSGEGVTDESEWITRRTIEASTAEGLIAAVDVQTMHETTCPDGLTVRLFEQKVVTMDQADYYAYRFDAAPSSKTVGFWLTVQDGDMRRAWWMWDFFQPEGRVKNFTCVARSEIRFDAVSAWGKPGAYAINLRNLEKITVKLTNVSIFKKMFDSHAYLPNESAAGRLMASVTSVRTAKQDGLQVSALESAPSDAAKANGSNIVLTLAKSDGDFSVFDLGLDVHALEGLAFAGPEELTLSVSRESTSGEPASKDVKISLGSESVTVSSR